jgi:hypothetical protein
MVERLRIGPGASSPVLVSVAGVNASGANFTQLVFNGNTPPLRVWQTGSVFFNRGASGGLPLPFPVAGPGGFATPSGTFPIFMVASTRNISGANTTNTPVRGIGTGGTAGGLMTPSGQFIGLDLGLPSAPSTGYINYLIFRNYG